MLSNLPENRSDIEKYVFDNLKVTKKPDGSLDHASLQEANVDPTRKRAREVSKERDIRRKS